MSAEPKEFSPPLHRKRHLPGSPDALPFDVDPELPALRSLGHGPNQACPGNDPRLAPPKPGGISAEMLAPEIRDLLNRAAELLELRKKELAPKELIGYAAKRQAAYVAESDPLLLEALYDRNIIFGPPGDPVKFNVWVAKVTAIKARFPKTT